MLTESVSENARDKIDKEYFAALHLNATKLLPLCDIDRRFPKNLLPVRST